MNKKNIVKRVLIFGLIILGILLIAVFLMVLFSPYGNKEGRDGKLVESTILINAPVEQIFAYLGNSDNASEWSVFVDHISPLNSYEVADGNPGSIRPCFVKKDEKGKSWDEEVLVVDLNKQRLLSYYNYRNFVLTAGVINTEQLYEETKEGHCLLSLTLFFPQEKTNLLKHLKMYYAAYQVSYFFEENLKNIKQFNEGGNQ